MVDLPNLPKLFDERAAAKALGVSIDTLRREPERAKIAHTVAIKLRKRGVALAEVAGFIGHSTGYRTTERYAKYGPDHLSRRSGPSMPTSPI